MPSTAGELCPVRLCRYYRRNTPSANRPNAVRRGIQQPPTTFRPPLITVKYRYLPLNSPPSSKPTAALPSSFAKATEDKSAFVLLRRDKQTASRLCRSLALKALLTASVKLFCELSCNQVVFCKTHSEGSSFAKATA